MNDFVNLLKQRLFEISENVRRTKDALGFLALGSCGKNIDRMDEYSDLDFFVIAKDGKKMRFIENLDWLFDAGEPDYYFKNTKDGYKYLYNDGVYCEFAVFEVKEMENVSYSEGSFMWRDEALSLNFAQSTKKNRILEPESIDWAIGEILTCLFVGLNRYARGELLTGTKFVQSFAVDLLLSISKHFAKETDVAKDDFQNDRRYELRYPEVAKHLPMMMQGYDRTPQSAIYLVEFLDKTFNINRKMRDRIINLAKKLVK